MTEKQLKERQERLGSTIGKAPIVFPQDRVKMEQRAVKRSKHGAVRTEYGGMMFDSKHEAACWKTLESCQRIGGIVGLQRQVTFPFWVNGKRIGSYRADFVYWQACPSTWMVADAKSVHTVNLASWIRTKKLVIACYGIEVKEMMS